MDGVKIRIGGQTRLLRFDFDQVEMAERLLGGEEIRDVLMFKRSTINIFKIAAAGFSEGGRDGKKVSPPQVKAWVKEEPQKLKDLAAALDVAVAEHLVEVRAMSEEDFALTKKGLAEVREAMERERSGTSSSAPPESSDSTPSSSEG